MKEDSSPNNQVTDQQLHEAEEGLIRLLHAKRFRREWIERHVPEAMAQARTDFAVRLAAGREDDTVNLLVVIGYRRALKVLRSQKTGPPTTSLETVFHLADDSTPTPEEETIEHDRSERVVKAMGHLPERERKLMALVYYEGMSIRAAGRRLGWGKSVANRHHQAALDRLSAMLDRSLLAPEIAIPAFIAARHYSMPQAVAIWIEGASETIREVAILGVNRSGGALEAGNAAAMSGVGRTASGVCGAVVVACLAGAATGIVGPGLAALTPGHAHQQQAPSPGMPPAQETSATADPARRSQSAAGQKGDSTSSRQGAGSRARGDREPARAHPLPERRNRRSTTTTPSATPKQTVEEFGVESGNQGEEAAPRSESPTENTPISPPASPQPESSRSGSSSESSGGSAPAAGGSSEFGM